MKLLTRELEAQLARAAAKGKNDEGVSDSTEESPVVVKFFTPDAQCTWFILDGEKLEDGDWQLFGLCDLGFGFPELGYVMLSELAEVRGKLGLPVERDMSYSGTLADARKQVRS